MDELLQAIREDRLTDSEISNALPLLVDHYRTDGDYRILLGILKIQRRNASALDPVFPEFARMLRTEGDEGRICDLLQTLVQFEMLPADIEQAVADRFADSEREELFAKARAAAILMKFWPENYGARKWLEEGLVDESEYVRLMAAVALNSTGRCAEASIPPLMQSLNDEATSVRVAAAMAILQVEKETALAETAVSTLLESIALPDDPFIVKPHALSESIPSHRYHAAAALGGTTVCRGEVTHSLVDALLDDDVVLRITALRGLAQLGERNNTVLDAVRARLSDSHSGVAAEAAKTLRALSE